MIELDYLLSQGGRGLKYASDPTLVITGGAGSAPKVGGAANALVLEVGDAHLLEISGGAAGAVLEQCKVFRNLALESMHGMRTEPERMVGMQSGRALELLHQNVIWLADKLRIAYGEGALLNLLKMVCRASHAVAGGLRIADATYAGLNPGGLALAWNHWFEPSPHDMLETSQALQTLTTSEIISRGTALRIVSPVYDVEDLTAEQTLIEQEVQDRDQRAMDMQAQVQAKETLPE